MCGIAGYVGHAELPEDRILECILRMRRRGPDHQAAQRFRTADGRSVYLLHSRLSIIDLDPRAHQPFSRGPVTAIYNGELYNYIEVRESLAARGERFETSSDTEVLVAALAVEGWGALDRCEGMWAFALYDRRDESLTLCRDRFGEKPLYYVLADDGVYFGSEVKFIHALMGRRLPINYDQIYRFWVNGYKALYKRPRHFFEGLHEVPPGSYLRLTGDHKPQILRYWTPVITERPGMTYEEAVEGARERLIESVRLRLRADVPLAFCMSGGVDSNALISIAKRVFNYEVHGFTILNTDERYEERDMVDLAVREQGLRHEYIPLETRHFIPRLRELVRQHDAPVITINSFAQWCLMESVAEHGYKIAISGTSADELFSGYYDHHLLYLYEVRDDPNLFAASRAAWEQHIRPLTRNPKLRDADLFIRQSYYRDYIYLDAEIFSGYLTNSWSEPFEEEHFTISLMRNRMLNELFREATPVILHEEDLNAMYYSIENRSPFLDRRLFDFCYSIPSRHLVRDGRAKAVLRDAMAGIVPDAIRLNRRKVGFNVPIFAYMDIQDPDVQGWLLGDSPVYDHVKRDCMRALLTRGTVSETESKFLFAFVSAKMFIEEYGP